MIYSLLSTLATALALPWAVVHGLRRGYPPRRVLTRLVAPRELQPCDIWLHGVSAGEIRALQPLIEMLQRTRPELRLTISSATPTGLQEAQRLSAGAPCFLLPFDVPWAMRHLARRLQPQWLLLSEGDLWPGMLQEVRAVGGRIAVVGAKLSDRSMQRWQFAPALARYLYRHVDLFCAQSQQMADRLQKWTNRPEAVVATGSLKEERALRRLSNQEQALWRQKLGLHVDQPVLLVGSTHPGEELLLLRQARSLRQEGWQIVICPRHPARLQQILSDLQAEGLNPLVVQGSDVPGTQMTGPRDRSEPSVAVVAQFGVLTDLMQLSEVVVIGGSFLPGIGGHNIFEPVQLGRPVLWGPHMENQRSLDQKVRSLGAGESIQGEELAEACRRWRHRASVQTNFSEEGPLEATWKALLQGLGDPQSQTI